MAAGTMHRDVKASGIRLRVAESGNGPSLLLLHDVLMDHTTWRGVLPGLAQSFRVAAPDLPGFGESEKPSDSRFAHSLEAFRGAVTDLFAALNLGRAIVVGHGLGGAIALTLAADHPELVYKLVLIDSLCYVPARDWLHRVAVTPVAGALFFKQLWGKGGFRRYFRENMLGPKARVPVERVDAYYDAFNSPASRSSALSTLRATRDTRSIVAATTRVRCPTLVAWGRHDRLYSAAQGQRLVRDIPQANFRLFDSGHVPQEELPEVLGPAISEFCRS